MGLPWLYGTAMRLSCWDVMGVAWLHGTALRCHATSTVHDTISLSSQECHKQGSPAGLSWCNRTAMGYYATFTASWDYVWDYIPWHCNVKPRMVLP